MTVSGHTKSGTTLPRCLRWRVLASVVVFGAVSGGMQGLSITPAHATSAGYLYFNDIPAKALPKGLDSRKSVDGKSVERMRLTPSATGGVSLRKVARTTADPVRGRLESRGSNRVFLFTPKARSGEEAVPISVGLSAATLTDTSRAALNGRGGQIGYDIDLALGVGGFALEAGYNQVDAPGLLDAGEGVNVGLSYGGRDWRTRVQVSGERHLIPAPVARTMGSDRSYSVEMGGAYVLTPSVSLTGGVKYSISYSNPQSITKTEDSNAAAFMGAAIKF